MSRFIARHQVVDFFGLAFLVSWAVWLLSPAIGHGDEHTRLVITLIGAYGPALAAMCVSSIVGPGSSGIKGVKRWQVFILVFAAADLVWLLSTEKFGPFDPGNLVLFTSKQVLAALVALVISGVWSSRAGVRDLLLPLTSWQVKPVWYLVVLLGFPMLIALAIFLASLLNAPLPAGYDTAQPRPWYQLVPGFLLAYFLTMVFQGPLNEEPGWRGLALSRLQRNHGAIAASILIGVIWGAWHAPLYFTGIYPGGMEAMLGRILWTIPLAFLFTWVYNHTRGSLLLTVLLHTAVNLQGDISSLVLQALRA